MSSPTGFSCLVRQHSRIWSIGRGTGPNNARLCGRPFPGFLGWGRGEIGFSHPTGLETGLHDHFLSLFPAHREILEGAVETLGFAVLAFAPANEVIGGATGKVLDSLDAFLAQRFEHG